MRKRKLNNKKEKFNVKILIFVIVMIFFLILSTTMAKYFLKIKDVQQVESIPFYFNSNIARINEANYCTEEWDGKNDLEISFNVSNYENQKLVTDEDIIYNIEVEKLNDNNNEITAKIYENNLEISREQTLRGNEKSTKNYILKIFANKKITTDLFKIKLKINAISPYTKELVSDINVNILNSNNYIESTIADNGEYITLKLQTNEYLESKSITYDNTRLILDQSNILLKNINVSTNDNKNSFIIPKSNFEKNTSYEIYFVKNDNNASVEIGKYIIIK